MYHVQPQITFTDNPRTVGTNKSVNLYPIDQPNELKGNASTLTNGTYFLHAIWIEPAFGVSADHADIAIMHSLISSAGTFALLTPQPLPVLCAMKCYFNYGSVSVTIRPGRKVTLPPNAGMLDQLRGFHSMLFRDLLQTVKPFLVNDHTNSNHSVFVVPILDNHAIDWDTVVQFQHLAHCQVVPEADRAHMSFAPADYLHKVVSPWYRYDKDSRYIVLKVHTDKTPLSPFPTPEFRTYADYMCDRYKLRTVNPCQFLIEVRGITQKLNRLSSGSHVDGSKKSAFRDQEFLIPELCHNYGFPAALWVKATLVPSILHRVHYLLHAESMRVSINRFMGNAGALQCEPKPLTEKWWDSAEEANGVAARGAGAVTTIAPLATETIRLLLLHVHTYFVSDY